MIIVTNASNALNIIATALPAANARIEPKIDEWRLVRDRHAVNLPRVDYGKTMPVPTVAGTLAYLPRGRIRSPEKVSVRTPYDKRIRLNLK